ncbi:MAG TPA: archaellin/type IV pilin N-terminal domain-containing protein [Candidatus Nitrosotenuis sp.]
MNLIRKGHRKSHRGVIGVESAIVMIAFVIVAAALAFVVLNMGFSTTQKAKTTIVSSLSEASSSLEVAGKVIAIGDTTLSNLRVVSIPIKVASGGDSVNLQNTTASIKYMSNSKEYDNIYSSALTGSTYANVTLAFAAANSGLAHFDNGNPVTSASAAPDNTKAIVYWSVRTNTNAILDQGEHANVAIAYRIEDKPSALDKIRVEIIVPTGAALTVERQVPSITTSVVDLG